MNRSSTAVSRTNYVARSAAYKAQRSAGERTRPLALATAAPLSDSPSEGFVDRKCSNCGSLTLDYASVVAPVCFSCSHESNPFAAKAIRMSVDATGEDSTNPDRVRDGTNIFNMGLPAQDVQYGSKDAYGQRKVVSMRAVANNEVASGRRQKEMAKRAGLTPLDIQKRAIGGR
jgi:hypothetical protein